jgi:type II secretory pathway component GspD/PulD (secretin)
MEEVIKYITKSLGLIYRIDKDVVWIAHPEEIANEALETRVYYLTKGGGLFTEFTAIGGGGTETALGSSSAQINKITTIEDTLKEVVPWPADSKLTFDKRINALIVRNTPQNLQMLEDMLYTLDVVPYQILIEARFLELDITDTKELGLEWKFNENWATDQRKGNKDGLIFAKDSGVDFSSFSRASEGLNLTYKGILTAPKFEAVLHALEESKKIKTLSSPRITTLNNQPAAIKVVDEWIYPTRYEYEIVQYDLNGDGDYNDAGETTYKNVPKDFQRRDVGILLKVIPSVGSDRKTINLSLVPEVSEATADAFSYTGDVKLPKFTSRNLATTIVVTSGDTVVLGGLIKENRTKTATRVPVLGSIPLLGNFFKKDADSIQRKNLLIFVTAKVLSASGEELVIPDREGR